MAVIRSVNIVAEVWSFLPYLTLTPGETPTEHYLSFRVQSHRCSIFWHQKLISPNNGNKDLKSTDLLDQTTHNRGRWRETMGHHGNNTKNEGTGTNGWEWASICHYADWHHHQLKDSTDSKVYSNVLASFEMWPLYAERSRFSTILFSQHNLPSVMN